MRQLLVESLLLACVGGGLGLAIAYAAGRGLSGIGSDTLPIPLDFHIGVDGTVLFYAFAASVATAVLFGLAPALTASRPDLVPALKADTTGQGSDRKRITLKDVLVVAQLATSVVLLIAGALLGRGLLAAQGTDIGFDPKPIASLQFSPTMNGYDRERTNVLREQVLERVRALPGVEAVSLTTRLPLGPDINMSGMRVPGHHGPEDDAVPIDSVRVGPDYFAVTGIEIVEGRAFTETDREGSPQVAVVNETMARKYWPGESAVGKIFYYSEYDDPPYEVVGVSRDHKVRSVGEDPRPYVHTPWLQDPALGIGLLVRVAGSGEAALPMLKKAVLELEPEIVFDEETTAVEVAEVTVAPTRIGAAILGAFSVLALLLAAVGLYGVISYSVTRRTREVGVRMAIGARPGDVLKLILAQGLKLAAVGVVIGAVASAGIARVLESLLYGVSAMDPVAYTAAALLLLIVAVAANLLPAYRASRTEPTRALRYE
jgi:putative ABC transport system permease protein